MSNDREGKSRTQANELHTIKLSKEKSNGDCEGKKFCKLIGKFAAIEHVGEIVNVMIFEDERYGSMTIGVLQSEDIQLHIPYQIIVSLHGKVRKYADGRIFNE